MGYRKASYVVYDSGVLKKHIMSTLKGGNKT